MAESDTDLENPLEKRLGYQLRRVSNAMMTDLAGRLEPLGLRIVEASVLVLIKANPAITQTEIGRCLGIQRANMVPLIAGLVGKGFLVKSPVDGRSLALSLTDAGDAMRAQVDALMSAHEARFEALLDGFDQARLREALIVLADRGDKVSA
jgi:DNA-binding MarR family transcriptional regulator